MRRPPYGGGWRRLGVHLRFGGHLMTTAVGSKGVRPGVDGGAPRKRRSWSLAERQRIVEAALAPGASVAAAARAHEVNANLVFKWIRRSREGWRDRRCGAGKRALRLSPRRGPAVRRGDRQRGGHPKTA